MILHFLYIFMRWMEWEDLIHATNYVSSLHNGVKYGLFSGIKTFPVIRNNFLFPLLSPKQEEEKERKMRIYD